MWAFTAGLGLDLVQSRDAMSQSVTGSESAERSWRGWKAAPAENHPSSSLWADGTEEATSRAGDEPEPAHQAAYGCPRRPCRRLTSSRTFAGRLASTLYARRGFSPVFLPGDGSPEKTPSSRPARVWSLDDVVPLYHNLAERNRPHHEEVSY